MRAIWINKGTWKKPGPIAYMGLLNALSFAWAGVDTELFIHGQSSDIERDVSDFYAAKADNRLAIHTISPRKGGRRPVYEAALSAIKHYCEQGEAVLALTREVGVLSPLIRLRRQYPALIVLHEVHDYYGSVRHLPRRRLSDYRRMLAERWTLPHINGLICLTEYQRALYQQWLPELPATAQPLGALKPWQTAPSQLGNRRAHRRVVYIGHLHDYKGLELIFKLADQLRDKQVSLVCYGGNQQAAAQFNQRAQQHKLDSCLHFHAFVSPQELSGILDQDSSIGLVPLQSTYYSRYLTCPVKALDFMAHGLPVVGSNIPSVKDILGSAGQLVASDDTATYAKVICELLDQDELYRQQSRLSFERAQALSWKNRAKQILDFAQQCQSET